MNYANPVYGSNFPDPGVLLIDGTYFAYGTNNSTQNVPLLTSTDLVNWRPHGDVLPELGSWATTGFTWAPEVLRTKDDSYVLYYTARAIQPNLQVIGMAMAESPWGPFVDERDAPFICQTAEGGSIDASPYRAANGKNYLYWKNDGNHIDSTTYLYAQALSDDGSRLTGEAVRLLSNERQWHKHVIEAPQMHRWDDRLYLFYSAGAYDAAEYSVGYAICDTPLGPCHDGPDNPILTSAGGAAGPGHCSVVVGPDGRSRWMLYHAWHPDTIGADPPGRTMWLDEVTLEDGRPRVHGPSDRAGRPVVHVGD